jgi:hypothetical protein
MNARKVVIVRSNNYLVKIKMQFLEFVIDKYDRFVSICSVSCSIFLSNFENLFSRLKKIVVKQKFEQEKFEKEQKEWSEKSFTVGRKRFVQLISRLNKKELLAYCASSFFIPSNQENLAVIEYVAVNSLALARDNGGKMITPYLFHRICNLAFKIQMADVWRRAGKEEAFFSAHIENLILRGTGRRPDQSVKSAIYRFEAHNKWLRENIGFSIENAIEKSTRIVDYIVNGLNNFFDFYNDDLEKVGLIFDQFGVFKAPARRAVKMIMKGLVLDGFIDKLGEPVEKEAFILRHSSSNYFAQESFGDEISLYDRPIVKIDKHHFLPFPSLLIEGLAENYYKDLRADTDYWKNESGRKGKAAEDRITEMLSLVFPKDFIFSNPSIKKGNELIDGLIIFENTAIIIESKSRYLPREARKTPEIINKYMDETIIRGLNQSVNAEAILKSGRAIELFNLRGNKIDISKRKITQYLTILILDERLSLMVTRDFLDKKKNDYSGLPFVVDINDLEYVRGSL